MFFTLSGIRVGFLQTCSLLNQIGSKDKGWTMNHVSLLLIKACGHKDTNWIIAHLSFHWLDLIIATLLGQITNPGTIYSNTWLHHSSSTGLPPAVAPFQVPVTSTQNATHPAVVRSGDWWMLQDTRAVKIVTLELSNRRDLVIMHLSSEGRFGPAWLAPIITSLLSLHEEYRLT